MTGDVATAAAVLALPDYAHHPGQNARPEGGVVAEVAEAAAEGTQPALDIAWHYGLRLLGEGFFWEAHEVLEPVWMAEPPNSAERLLVQGIIQFANASLKADMGRTAAARRLTVIARDCFAEAGCRGGEQVKGHVPAELVQLCDALERTIG